MQKELSIFVDESGMFGDFNAPTKNYQITFVFHDQSEDVIKHIKILEEILTQNNVPEDIFIHSGPLINNKNDFRGLSEQVRRKIFSSLFLCFKCSPVSEKTFNVEKKYVNDLNSIYQEFIRQMADFLIKNKKYFVRYDNIKVYYDRGRHEVQKILIEAFNRSSTKVMFKRNVSPKKYRLLQMADMVCELELVEYKYDNNCATKSERKFFGTKKDLRRLYLKALNKKRF